MVDCFRKDRCGIKSEGACSVRFEFDRCPNSQLERDDDDEMQLSPTGDVPIEEPD